VVVLAAVGGLVAALTQGGGTGGDNKAAESSSPSAPAAGYRPPELNRTMDTSDCTDPIEDSEDPTKVEAPDFRYKDIRSVKACMHKVGWTVRETDENNGAYADGQVIEQHPEKNAAVDPHKQEFELTVSNGKPE
jgi:hypothetical protein